MAKWLLFGLSLYNHLVLRLLRPRVPGYTIAKFESSADTHLQTQQRLLQAPQCRGGLVNMLNSGRKLKLELAFTAQQLLIRHHTHLDCLLRTHKLGMHIANTTSCIVIKICCTPQATSHSHHLCIFSAPASALAFFRLFVTPPWVALFFRADFFVLPPSLLVVVTGASLITRLFFAPSQTASSC